MADRRPRLEAVKDQYFVLNLAEGFLESNVLFALLDLDILERIGEGSRSVSELANDLSAQPETLRRLLNAGVALGLLSSEDADNYRVADRCRSILLTSAGDTYLGNWLRNMAMFRDATSLLGEAVLGSAPTVEVNPHIANPDATREFTLAMNNYAMFRGRELASSLDTSGAASLLDLGCGPGTYAFHLGAQNPALELNLLDLPEVLEVTREVEQRFELSNEINYLPVDVTRQDVPGAYDIVLISNMLHMLGEVNSRSLLERVYDNVAVDGSLVIQAQYLRNDGMGGRWAVLLDLIQMCITEQGRNHSEAETRTWLEDAGFNDIEFVPMSLVNTNSYMRAYKR